MLSRVADAIYWVSRYVERAENVARFVAVNEHLTLDLPGGDLSSWMPLVATTGDDGWFEQHYGSPTRENVIRFLTIDSNYTNSIVSCFRAARENARSAREIISQDMWECLNRSYLSIRQASDSPEQVIEEVHDFLEIVRSACHQFDGTTHLTMTHDESWHFMRLGRMLERADKTTRILDVKYFMLQPQVSDRTMAYEDLHWAALLRSASAEEMYRRRLGRLEPKEVVKFLLFDRDFPRAVRFCIESAEESLHAVSGGPPRSPRNRAERQLGRLRAELEYAEIDEILSFGLHEWVDVFQDKLNRVGAALDDVISPIQAQQVQVMASASTQEMVSSSNSVVNSYAN